ncbi:unnamed protein product [Cercopithifilaria johnstoni]|uniref:Uncharacterized protein n=1 Tax=Cercopithifilaria johnstoni TaxID=2874296 RepID=A0A8J2MC47_9BILA|nr:unnamed protein product [Cercopithifilaria johnstoni]
MSESLFMQYYDDSKYGSKHGDVILWTSEDTKRAVLFSLVPGSLALCAIASFSKEKNLVHWWSTLKKPNWAPKNPAIYGAIDLMTIAPLGYASYMAYKYGGGFAYNHTKWAMALYGGSMICAFITIPLVKGKNYVCFQLFRNSLIMHLTGAGAAFAFFKIHRKAGWLLVPYALWTGFYTYLTYCTTSEGSERSAF